MRLTGPDEDGDVMGRTNAAKGDVDEVHRHLGPMFSRAEAEEHTQRIGEAINSGKLKVKR